MKIDYDYSDIEVKYAIYVELQRQLEVSRDEFYTAVEKAVNEGESINGIAKKVGLTPGRLGTSLARRKAKK